MRQDERVNDVSDDVSTISLVYTIYDGTPEWDARSVGSDRVAAARKSRSR